MEIAMSSNDAIQMNETGRRLGHDLFRYKNPVAAREPAPACAKDLSARQRWACAQRCPIGMRESGCSG
jgi:hypothetical protein